jgi:protease PrsW
VISAALLVVLNPFIDRYLPEGNALTKVFFHASLLEKGTAFISLFGILKYLHKQSSIPEAISISIFYALGFSGLENIFYAYEVQRPEVILRFFSSVPLHLTTCALMGYFLGLYFLYSSTEKKTTSLVWALLIPIVFHTIYDLCLLEGGFFTYFIGPELVVLIVIQEYLIAKSSFFPTHKELRIKKITLENWMLIRRQMEYERWILGSMGKRNIEIVPFFDFRFTLQRKIVIFILLLIAGLFFLFQKEINALVPIFLRMEEQITLFSLFPAVGAFNIFLAGSINPEYFKNSILSLPIVSEITLWFKGVEQNVNGTDISRDSCFVKTLDTFEVGEELEFIYIYSSKLSPSLKAKVIWDNHENLLEPIGTLLHIENPSLKFQTFLLQYYFFRFTRGLIFNLKIPGFERLRNHFVKAITVMEDHAYVTEGTILFEEGDKGKEFYLLKKGRVEIFKTTEMGEKLILTVIEPGSIFGEMAMITGQPRAATAICATNCLLSTADSDNLEALVMNNPQFSFKLMQTLAHRLSHSEGILMKRIQDLETQVQILTEQNAILEEYINNPEWINQAQNPEKLDSIPSPQKKNTQKKKKNSTKSKKKSFS